MDDRLVNITKILLITIILIFIIFFLIYYNGKKIIVNNWNQYCCNPIIIPIAGLFGKNTSINMKKCMFLFFKSFFQFLILPFSYIIKIIQKIFAGLFKDINAFRTFLKPIRIFILKSTQTFYEKINNFTNTIVYSFSKIRNTLKRMAGIFRLTLYSLEVAQLSLKSIWDGPIGSVSRKWEKSSDKIATFFCVLPNTLVLNYKEQLVPIYKLKLGDKLYSNNKENNILLGMTFYYADNISIFKYKNTYCSSEHLVLNNKKWLRVKEICEKYGNYSGILMCPITSSNIFHTTKYDLWRDFEEYNKLDKRILEITLYILNKKHVKIPITKISQCIGFYAFSKLGNKLVKNFRIGDKIGNDIIKGIHILVNTDDYIYFFNNIYIGGRQLYYDSTHNKWYPMFMNKNAIKIRNKYKNMLFFSFMIDKDIITINDQKYSNILDSLSNKVLKKYDNIYKKYINNSIINH